MITVRFICGHEIQIAPSPDIVEKPVCYCGETLIEDVLARPPHFTGVVRGPHAEYRELEPRAVRLDSKGK